MVVRAQDVGITRIKLLPKAKAKSDSQIMATPSFEGLNKHKAPWRNLRLLFRIETFQTTRFPLQNGVNLTFVK